MSLFNIILNQTRVVEGIKDKIEEVKYTTRIGAVVHDKIDEVKSTRVGEFVQDVNKGIKTGLHVTGSIGQTLENGLDSWKPESYLRRFFGPGVTNLQEGDHLWVQRIGYTHHGIYLGTDQVIHYLQEGVSIDSLEMFAYGSKIYKKDSFESPTKYSNEKIVERAFYRLGEDNYNLGINNCEHFCRWCRNGH